jgi:hypothetical protein
VKQKINSAELQSRDSDDEERSVPVCISLQETEAADRWKKRLRAAIVVQPAISVESGSHGVEVRVPGSITLGKLSGC